MVSSVWAGLGRFTKAVAIGVILVATVQVGAATALPDDGDLATVWSGSVAPFSEPGGGESVPGSVAVANGTVLVARGTEVARYGRTSGTDLGSWAAPADVTIRAVAAGPDNTVIAVGTKGDDGWVGRYSSAGAVAWSTLVTKAAEVRLSEVTVVGNTAYVAGNVGTAFDAGILVRRYDAIDTSPTMAWESTPTPSGIGDGPTGIAVSTTAAYVAGSSGPSGSATVWRLATATGAATVKESLDGTLAFFRANATDVAASGDRVYVSYTRTEFTAAGLASDAYVARLDPVSLATTWSASVGEPVGILPDLGTDDLASGVAVDGDAVVLVGASDDPAISSPVPGLSGSGGFLARYSDNGSSATRQFIRRAPVLGAVEADGGDVFVITGADAGSGLCGAAPGSPCTLARITDGGDPPAHGFSDVPAGAFYDEAVSWLKAENITTGTSPTTYSPNDPVTRGQMAAFLFRLAGEPPGSPAHGFSDVPVGAFYDEAVSWLKAEGITTGTSPTTFSPNDPVTRGQMAAFLFRYATGG